jgi:hypothetical protein
MRVHGLAILCASASLFALPALAQNLEQQNGSATDQTPNHSQPANSEMSPRKHLIHDLKQAGFTNIRVEPEAFVVHAVNSQGEPVLMRITPESIESVTAMREGQNGQGASNNTNGANHADASNGVNNSNEPNGANGMNGSNAWHASKGTNESGGSHASVDMNGYNNPNGVSHTGQNASANGPSNNQ